MNSLKVLKAEHFEIKKKKTDLDVQCVVCFPCVSEYSEKAGLLAPLRPFQKQLLSIALKHAYQITLSRSSDLFAIICQQGRDNTKEWKCLKENQINFFFFQFKDKISIQNTSTL